MFIDESLSFSQPTGPNKTSACVDDEPYATFSLLTEVNNGAAGPPLSGSPDRALLRVTNIIHNKSYGQMTLVGTTITISNSEEV